MADNLDRDQALEKVTEPAPDPIADKSLSAPILVFTLLLMVSLAWALYDELFGLRPWKSMQNQFADRYVSFLNKKVLPAARTNVKDVQESSDYQNLQAQIDAAKQAADGELKIIAKQLDLVNNQISAVQDPFSDQRARIAAIRYKSDQSDSQSAKASYQSEIDDIAKETRKVSNYPDENGNKSDLQLNFAQLQDKYNALNKQKSDLSGQQAKALKPQKDLQDKQDRYVQDHLNGLNETQVKGLINKYENFDVKIQQINIPEANIVDRCESCHVGIREPITITKADMKGDNAGAFTSHPDKDLLAKHDPDKFGCTACHGGNGRATTSEEKAHGNYEHWLWPMYAKENMQSGCNQCHNKDVVLAGANVLNRGKELFMERGCVGCHKYEGFDHETDGLAKATQQIKQFEMDKEAAFHQIEINTNKANDSNTSDADAKQLLADVSNIRQRISQIDGRIQQLDIQTKYLLRDQKKVGPNLKEVRFKLKKEFIPEWLRDPQAFRPGTKMPTFRLSDEERQAVAAFIWQSGWDGISLEQQPQGDAGHGKELFETRGCLACHSIGEGANRVGGDFSANLSRVGDKDNYDYVVRWVHDPRVRSLPYSPSLKRDLTKEDYDKAGVPFVFDEQHSTSPVDQHQIQVQSMTVMPVFRLSEQDARDIATFLMSQKTGAQYPEASFMDNPALKSKGEALVKQYGCAGCHEIKGLEEQQKIGTELTVEGSKPIERLDFALFTHKAEAGILPDGRENIRNGVKTSWYDAKGFFEQKLTNPAIYDVGKQKGPDDRLRMPNIYFKDRSEIDAVTTFLLGSVDTTIPANLKYAPADQRQFVQDGWWIVKKYNCMGCHNLQVGQASTLMGEPQYQGDNRDKLPPRLVTEGARVNPDWLLKFLNNPSLSDTDTNRNGVRQYLAVRMPTFQFSPNELQTLVRFFTAYSSQPTPYIPEQMETLQPQERDMARALFTSQAAPCLKCHMTGDPSHDKLASAPNFLLARERLKPQWVERWIVNPELIDPTTAMPSKLFNRDEANNRFVFSGQVPDSFNGYKKDHADLLVRYMFQITPDEQAKLGVKGGSSSTTASSPSGGTSPQKAGATSRNNVPGKNSKKKSVERVAMAKRAEVVTSP